MLRQSFWRRSVFLFVTCAVFLRSQRAPGVVPLESQFVRANAFRGALHLPLLPAFIPSPAPRRQRRFWVLSQSCRCLLIVSFVRFPSATGLWVLFRSCRGSLMEQVPLRMAPVQAPWRGSVFWRGTRATVSRTMVTCGAGLPTIFGPAPATDSSVFIVLTDG